MIRRIEECGTFVLTTDSGRRFVKSYLKVIQFSGLLVGESSFSDVSVKIFMSQNIEFMSE
jgi:hypothetical protein